MHIEQNGTDVTFTLTVGGETIQGTGSVSGQQMNLSAATSDGAVTMALPFAADGMSFTGT